MVRENEGATNHGDGCDARTLATAERKPGPVFPPSYSLGDAHLRTWTLRFTALLAADTQDQLAWLGERELETKDVVEEVEFLCHVSEGLAERGAFDPTDLRDLRAIGRRLGKIDTACRVGLWANALATDPEWDDIRSLTRQFLLAKLGDWRQPLPHPVRAHTDDR
ncbi:hypothetical protein OG372_25440 [Streptomyces sp. NBC_01020]|uniref:hypothetical protein n=1 Tax=unclassified Streptomyces TaxID=2593676 RepID=UPI002E22A3AA|nr:hypothetical protein OG372_25440 [Streptomyces sp. NBC_01020]